MSKLDQQTEVQKILSREHTLQTQKLAKRLRLVGAILALLGAALVVVGVYEVARDFFD
jgi:hypothetical protein